MSIARKSLVSFLLAGLLIAGCSDSAVTSPSPEDGQAAPPFEQGEALKASFTDPGFPGMKGIAENDQLRMFADELTGAIAVLHKRSGQIWHSNPPERSSDGVASGINKDLLSAQLKIEYYNSFGQLNAVNSYTDSVRHKQIKFQAIPNGVRVSYQFGTDEKTAQDLPKLLSVERFEELIGKLDNTGQRAIRISYRLDKEKNVYQRSDGVLQGIQLTRALKAFEDAGYTEELLAEDMAELGFTQDKPEPTIFLTSIEYTLDADSLVVNVPASGIRYPDEYPVSAISLLSFFGAGGPEDEGSLFVPDGSGALIRFNNGKTKYPAYQQSVYGQDLTTNMIENAVREQTVRLPVFGIIKEEGAFLGIIEKGAAAATINADVSGRLNSYNYVYPSFTVINKGDLTLNAGGQKRSLPMFQEEPMKTDFTVRYVFLGREDASYTGMAKYYQEYLIDRGGLPQAADTSEQEGLPFFLQLIGSISKQQHFVGVPYRKLEPLTTFEQAEAIVNRMIERGIGNIKLKYSGWFNGGLDHKVPGKIAVDEAVGGAKGLRDFIAFAREQGVSFYPDVALLTANTADGFKETKEASRTLRDVPAAVYPLDLALNRRDRDKSPSFVVSPRLVAHYTEAMLDDLRPFETGGISLRDLADQLNSDYREHKQIDRAESEGISVQALNRIREAGLSVMADGGNAYALPFVTNLTDAPMGSSGFKIEDESIPFYQMVIRGFIDYTGEPFNLSSYTNEKQYLLKCLEYGAGVYFEWIYAPNHQVKDTEFDHLYAVNYELWLDKAAGLYRETNEALKNVRHARIAEHEKLEEGVYKTVYENGFYVIVNYNGEPVSVEGKAIEAESYLTGGELS